MLLMMTMNAQVCIAIALGIAFGSIFFGYLSSKMAAKNSKHLI